MKTYFAVSLFVFVAFESADAQHSAPNLLDNAGLKAAYSGKTHLSRYWLHVEDYGGVVFEETYNADGTLHYRAGDVEAVGDWRIENGAICFRYEAHALLAACFVVAYEEGCFYSYELLGDGSARGLQNGEWWIRSTLQGTDPDCGRDLVS